MKSFLGHSFHIPVLGTGFSIDTPIKVAPYGISSVISLVDDNLMEQLRKKICEKYNEPYFPIHENEEDFRARRITEYLNLINRCVKKQFAELKDSSFTEEKGIKKYLNMLPDYSTLKKKYKEMTESKDEHKISAIETWIRKNLFVGSIDVNIMTKVDKINFDLHGEQLPHEFNDAHSALRGFANSDLESSVVFSAGMSPKLYSYAETFKDFFPDSLGELKKKIILKVSDFRSALIQGKFLAKKGLWVSEYRVESGLNCGGHAFATEGSLAGPILEEFKNRKDELLSSLKEILHGAWGKKEIQSGCEGLDTKVTFQGGVGQNSEHEFLLRRYELDSIGWGSPFLLVPEVVNIDDYTLDLLCKAGEDDLYLSNISPLGVPFNSVKGNSKEKEKVERIEAGKPGSPCAKRFLLFKKEISEKPICTASLAYIKKVMKLKEDLGNTPDLQKEYDSTLEKECLCEGLSASALIVNNSCTTKQSTAVSVCPGPNLAYFDKAVSMSELIDHIYGRINLISVSNRPYFFIKELDLYINYLHDQFKDKVKNLSQQTEEYILNFKKNLNEEIKYYKSMIPDLAEETEKMREKIQADLDMLEEKLFNLFPQIA